MLRRVVFSLVAIAVSSLLAVSAQDAAKPDRLSGVVRQIDKSAMKITMAVRNQPTAQRVILYDANTRIKLGDKPVTIDDVREGMRIVAIGKFEGVQLKATDMTLRLQ